MTFLIDKMGFYICLKNSNAAIQIQRFTNKMYENLPLNVIKSEATLHIELFPQFSM